MMQARVFRRLDSIRYRGAVHEQLGNSRGNLRMLVNNDWQIYHTGYSASNFRQKAERNLVLLKEKAKSAKTQQEKEQLANLVKEHMENNEETGLRVYIGDELPIQTMKDCSVVTAHYELGNGLHGTIGIIGPKRMDYEKVVGTLQTLKTQFLGSKNPRLHTDEVLIALSATAANNEEAALALKQLPKLKGCQAHSTVMLSSVDLKTFKKLNCDVTCDARTE